MGKHLLGCFLRERNTLHIFNWDKNFLRAYSDDVDICVQVQIWGFQCWTACKALIYHGKNTSHIHMKKEGIIPPMLGARNRRYLIRKWKIVKKIKDILSSEALRRITLGTDLKIEDEKQWIKKY